jgi:hypothetical protein
VSDTGAFLMHDPEIGSEKDPRKTFNFCGIYKTT